MPKHIRRVRWMLLGLSVFWLLMTGVSLWGAVAMDLPAPPGEEPPPEWLTVAVPGLVSAIGFVAAATFKPGAKGGWGMAATAAVFNCLSCTLPFGVLLVVWLFDKRVKAEVLGGGFAS